MNVDQVREALERAMDKVDWSDLSCPPCTEEIPTCKKCKTATLHRSEHPRAGVEYGYTCHCEESIGLFKTQAEAVVAWKMRNQPVVDEVEALLDSINRCYADGLDPLEPIAAALAKAREHPDHVIAAARAINTYHEHTSHRQRLADYILKVEQEK